MNRLPLLACCVISAALFGCDDGGDASDTIHPEKAAGPVVIAHRGYSGLAPEHTMLAYDMAASAGADYIEQDLQMTSDGVLIALHDATLDRTARGPADLCTGPVIERTLEEVRQCDFGSWFNESRPALARPEFQGLPAPTLDEVFARFGTTQRYYIETKNPEEAPGMEEALIAVLDCHGLRGTAAQEADDRVLVQSFSAESLRRMSSLAPDLNLVQLFGRMPSDQIRASLAEVSSYARGIGPHFSSVDSALVADAHALGLVIHPYTVNDEAEMRRLLALGVDGFFTDQTSVGLEQVSEASPH